MDTLAKKLVRLVIELQYDVIPVKVIEKTKKCILDGLACSYAGYNLDWSRAALELVKDFEAKKESTVWISGIKTIAPYAAYVNSVMSNSIIHEDFHLSSGSHPGTVIIPVAFSVGERCHSTGKEILTAIVAGYEVIGRLGKVVSAEELSKRGFRPSSILCAFGAAVTAGKLLGLKEEEMVNALGAAGSFASGVNEWAFAGTDDFYFQSGNSSSSGIISAYLAGKGLRFANSIIEGGAGISRAFTGIARGNDYVFENFEQRNEIMEVYFKPVPACGMVQTTAQLALEMVKSGLDYRDIRNGVIRTNFMGKHYPGCDYVGPFKSMTQARMSNQYSLASVLYTKQISNGNYEIYGNEDIFALANKFTVEVDDEANKLFPGKQMIKVSLVLKDGSSLNFKKNDIDHYANDNAIIEKFRINSSRIISSNKTEEICSVVDKFENLESASGFVNLLSIS